MTREKPRPPRRPSREQPQTDSERTADSERVAGEERAPEDVMEDPVDEANVESFPASDPPSFTPSRAGTPARKPGDE